jgi:hypothetical protein
MMLDQIYAHYLESPCTKAYPVKGVRQLFMSFGELDISTPLTHGDLSESNVGQRHRSLALIFVRKLWPPWLIRICFPDAGLFVLKKRKNKP